MSYQNGDIWEGTRSREAHSWGWEEVSQLIRYCVKIFTFSLKTGLLKWSPDYDTAANHYDKAGKGYQWPFNVM